MRSHSVLVALFGAALVFAGCSESSGGADTPPDVGSPDAAVADTTVTDAAADAAPDAAPDATQPDAGPDLTEAVFALDHLIEVNLEIDPADWDTLRAQERDFLDVIGPRCQEDNFESPYDWFHARVTVDGTTYEDVGVRKKGFFGSVSETRPSVKVRFDKYVDGQRHETLTRLTLNNNRQDPSRLRTCLAYSVFAAAGVPTPRCNFAVLTVNGREMGVYSHVESLQRPFLRRNFADDSGHLYEGTLSDFRPGWTGTIEQKTHESEPYTAGIDAVVAALGQPDDQLIEALEGPIDLDRYFTFWALEVITAHWDGYAGNTNNFWFYDDPTSGQIHFVPWGTDATFGRPRLFSENQQAPWSVLASGMLARRLYAHPEGRRRYLARLDELLATHWDVAALQARVDAMQAVVRGAVLPQLRADQRAAVEGLREYVVEHARRILTEVINGPVEWTVPLRETFCMVPVGELRGTFETTWGTFPTDNAFETGTGTLSGRFNADEFVAANAGAAAGLTDSGATDSERAALLVPGFVEGFGVMFMYVEFDVADAVMGALDFTEATGCSLNFINQIGEVNFIATCPEGRIEFEAIDAIDGAPVRGSYTVELWAQQ